MAGKIGRFPRGGAGMVIPTCDTIRFENTCVNIMLQIQYEYYIVVRRTIFFIFSTWLAGKGLQQYVWGRVRYINIQFTWCRYWIFQPYGDLATAALYIEMRLPSSHRHNNSLNSPGFWTSLGQVCAYWTQSKPERVISTTVEQIVKFIGQYISLNCYVYFSRKYWGTSVVSLDKMALQ